MVRIAAVIGMAAALGCSSEGEVRTVYLPGDSGSGGAGADSSPGAGGATGSSGGAAPPSGGAAPEAGSGGEAAAPVPDSGDGEAGAQEAGGPRDAGRETGGDAAPEGCPEGRKDCGGACADEGDPVTGCSGADCEPCPEPANSSASCGADGACSFDCDRGFRRSARSTSCIPEP